MNTPFLTRFRRLFRGFNQWFSETPERALDQAYDAALKIKAIEDEYFEGNFISARSNRYSDNILSYFQGELNTYLRIATVRLSEFRTSRSVVSSANTTLSSSQDRANEELVVDASDRSSIVLEKLRFIDGVLDRYKSGQPKSSSLVPVAPSKPPKQSGGQAQRTPATPRPAGKSAGANALDLAKTEEGTILDKTGVLPRSILGTLNRIKRELDPRSERKVVQSFRTAQVKTIISIRFLLLLIIIPLLTQQLSKTFIIGPVVDYFRPPDSLIVFINYELEDRALEELRAFENRLQFDMLIGRSAELSPQALKQKVKGEAEAIAQRYRMAGSDAIKNVFADLVSLIAFTIVIASNRREIEVLKTFIDETIYGLSDSAKAFIIILFTDMFVGFHSPHGWEVLLEGLSKHFGLPANRDFIFLFIATFPVILDTIFKYWIFRYLNRISPSAVATYKNMNET